MTSLTCVVCGREASTVETFPTGEKKPSGAPIYGGASVCSRACAQALRRRLAEMDGLDWRIVRDALRLGIQQPRQVTSEEGNLYCPNEACAVQEIPIEEAVYASGTGLFYCPQCHTVLETPRASDPGPSIEGEEGEQ